MKIWIGIVMLAVLGTVGIVIGSTSSLPVGPVLPVWDRDVCAHCHMHVGEPDFAAQLQTDLGDVRYFDDPGCLFEYLDGGQLSAQQAAVHAIYFREHGAERWLAAADVGFVEVPQSPMGYGLAAVPASRPGAIGFSATRARIRRAKEEE
jgi:hypothetical protein